MRYKILRWTGSVSVLVLVITGWIVLLPARSLVQAEEPSISIFFPKQQAVEAFQTGRFDEAAQLFAQQAQSHEGDEHKAWFNAGASCWNAGRKKEAFQMYEQAVAVSPLYFLGHKRLAIRYESAEQPQLAQQHRDHALAIRKVEKTMKPLWEKAHSIRTKGGDWRKATVLVHEKSAQAYETIGYPDFARAERQLGEQSEAEMAVEVARVQNLQQRVQQEAQERTTNAKLLNSLTAMASKGGHGGVSGGASAAPGLGLLQQAYSGYSQTADAFTQQDQQRQELIHQQGEQTQAAFADPRQSHAQRDASQRSAALRQRLEAMELAATQMLMEEGQFEDLEPVQVRDTLDP